MGFRGTTSSSFSINSFSSTELNRFGSAPRVKTKPNKTSTSTNLKRQISDSYVPDDYFSSRKRRHSADSLKNDSVDKDSSLLENSNDNNNSRESAIDLAKCVNEIGQALRGFDVESLDANFLSSDLLSSDSTQSGMSNLTISGGNISTNLSADNSLSSSLSLCQTMGINHGVSSNLAVNLGGSQNPIVVEQGQVVNQLLAPNMAVTKGMMVSLPNVTQVQNLAVYQGNLKEILPAPSSVKQQCTSPGLYVTSQVCGASRSTVHFTSILFSFLLLSDPSSSFSFLSSDFFPYHALCCIILHYDVLHCTVLLFQIDPLCSY